jgi:gas vesicle protein
MSNTSKSTALLLAGVAAGVTLGMLFAPRKGSENRKKLSRSVKNLGDNASEKFGDLVGFTGGFVVSMLNNNADMYQYDDVEHAII